MNTLQRLLVSTALLLGAPLQAVADDTARLRCYFEYGQIEVNVNYTRGTINDTIAIIDDKEIVWTPPDDSGGLAVINRYSGVMQISKGNNEYTGMCKRIVEQ